MTNSDSLSVFKTKYDVRQINNVLLKITVFF